MADQSPFMARSFQRALLAARQSCHGRLTSTPTTPPGRTGRLMGPPGSATTLSQNVSMSILHSIILWLKLLFSWGKIVPSSLLDMGL